MGEDPYFLGFSHIIITQLLLYNLYTRNPCSKLSPGIRMKRVRIEQDQRTGNPGGCFCLKTNSAGIKLDLDLEETCCIVSASIGRIDPVY